MQRTASRIWIAVSLTFVVGVSASLSTRCHAQVPEPPRNPLSIRVELMRETLHLDADQHHVSQLHIRGAAMIVLGLLGASFGTYLLLDGAGMNQTATRAVAAAPFFTYGLMFSVSGVRLLIADETFAENRLHRFDALRARGPISDREIARFEAELYMSAWSGRDRRITEGFSSIGMALAGLGLLGFALSGELDEDALGLTATLGGTYSVLGLWQMIALLTGESSEEERWRRYVEAVNLAQRSIGAR